MAFTIKNSAINIKEWAVRTFQSRTLIIIGAVVLLGLLVAGFSYWNKPPEINWRFLLGGLTTQQLVQESQKIELENLNLEGMSKTGEEKPLVATPGKVYEETAQQGEGITHLARKALKDYLAEKGAGLNLTPEHKIYIEDYVKDRTGDRWLKIGETLTFSEELLVEAINQAQQLSASQLENLKQYSQLVSF